MTWLIQKPRSTLVKLWLHGLVIRKLCGKADNPLCRVSSLTNMGLQISMAHNPFGATRRVGAANKVCSGWWGFVGVFGLFLHPDRVHAYPPVMRKTRIEAAREVSEQPIVSTSCPVHNNAKLRLRITANGEGVAVSAIDFLHLV